MSVMKQRDAYTGTTARPDRLSDQASQHQRGERRQGNVSKRIVDGQFDSIYLRDTSVWLHIQPNQSWEQWVWDRDLREPVKAPKTWYQYEKHFYPANKRSMICSAGPRRADPCFGCAIRRAHYNKMNAIEERTGVRPKGEPPISGQSQFAFSVMVMEEIVKLPKRNADGSPKVSKAGTQIYEYVPEPWVGGPVQGASKMFGRRYHISLSKTHWSQLIEADQSSMRNYCANCATGLVSSAVACPDCETQYALSGPESGDSLTELRNKNFECACGYAGPMVPQLTCSGCGHPEEGRLTDFDIRVKKEVVTKTASNLKIISVRKPLSTISSEEVRQRVLKEMELPLNLPSIFVPSTIEEQQRLLGDICKGVDPRPGNHKTEQGTSADVESYHDESDDLTFG